MMRTGLIVLSILLAACDSKHAAPIDKPRLAPHITMEDIVFRSASLDRDMPYRVFLPQDFQSTETLPVVYLLHGNGGGFRDWSNYSDIASLVQNDRWILVMPEGDPRITPMPWSGRGIALRITSCATCSPMSNGVFTRLLSARSSAFRWEDLERSS